MVPRIVLVLAVIALPLAVYHLKDGWRGLLLTAATKKDPPSPPASYWLLSILDLSGAGQVVLISAFLVGLYIVIENGEYFQRQYKRNEELRVLLEKKRAAMIEHTKELRTIADAMDKCHKEAAIANVAGRSVSATGGVATIAGLALAPATMGASLLVSSFGIGAALTGAAIKYAYRVIEAVSNKRDLEKVANILQSCLNDLKEVSAARKACEDSIKTQERVEDHERLQSEIKSVWQEFFNDEVAGSGTSYEFKDNKVVPLQDAVKFAMLVTGRVLDDVAQVILPVAARAGAQATAGTAAKVIGVLSALFLPLDVYDIYKNSVDIHTGAKTALASRIREVADMIRSIVKVPKRAN